VDYICTDKTGTLTQHNMTVKEFFINNVSTRWQTCLK
jgi:P-type E1-E2 ATPase